MSTYPVGEWLERPELEPVWLVRFEGFEGGTVGGTFEGTYPELFEHVSTLVQCGARNVRYIRPDGLEVQCRLRRGAVLDNPDMRAVDYV